MWSRPNDVAAVLTSVRITDGLGSLGLAGCIGVATGRVWVGVSMSNDMPHITYSMTD